MIKIKLSNKPSFIYYVIFIAALFLSNTSDSQNLIFNHYGLNEGLPQETVLCITKDSKGFFWLGTSDGIVRFDGHDFTIPQPDYNSKSDIAGYRIGAALEHNNLLYVGTSQNGLLAYDLDYETTTQVLDSDTNCTRLSKYEELIIAAYYNKGVAIIEKNTQKFLHFNIEDPKEIVGLTILKNQGYLATKQGAIYKFSLDNVSKNETIILEEIAHSDVEIINLVTIENTIFVGLEYGLLELNTANNVLNEIKIIDKNTPLNFRINTLKKANNTFYLATSNGILTAAKKQDTLKVIHHYKADKKDKLHTVSYNSINDLYVDDENLLIGSFNLEVTAIHKDRVFKKPLSVYNLTDASTFGVIDTKNYLFTATSSGLVISDNSNPSKYIVLPKIRGRHFVKDNHNNIWCATGNSIYIINLDTLDIDNPVFTEVPAETGNPSHLLSGNIRSLHKDLKGDIWAVSYNGGFSKFIGHVNSKDFSFINYSSEAFPSVFTISMIQDSYGTYWMTSQKGLSAFHFEGDKFQLKKNYDETHGLATRGVLGAFEDHEKTLWIATRKGISKYNRDDDRFISYGRRDGLTNTFVYDIHEDNAHELWLSTNGGLFKFNKDTEIFSNYNPKDGVQSTEFNLGAVYKNEDNGHLYFGGINGLNIFDPSQIHKLDKEGQLNFTKLSVKDSIIGPSSNSILESSIINAKSITVNYDDFPINLSFSGLDFRPNSNVKYVYKLLPEDTDWSDLGYKNYIQLLTLAPKNYTLQIQGKSRNDLWQKPPLELSINVKPPWYRSNIAYLFYLLSFLGIVYAFYRISLQRQIAGQESKRLQDLDNLKSRFITNITHEFRTPLTIILGYLGNLKERFSGKDDVSMSLNTIEQNSNNLLNLVNQMLDLAKLEQGKLSLNITQNDIVNYVDYIINSFLSIAKDKNIHLIFNSKEDELIMDFDAEKMRQILTNLISNAIKFSSETSEIKIHLERDNQNLILKVEDQGLGIPENELPHIFDRFFQVETQEHKVSQGTGVGLALTKELVLLLNGTITATSKVNHGTTFTVTLPIQNNASQTSLELKELHATIGETFVPELDDVLVLEDTNSVLIVEDNSDMARYIASCLQPQYKVLFAKNGLEGFEKAQVHVPDIIITDIMMPVMDGFELTQNLQSHVNTNHIPVIMLTSKAMQEDKLEGILSGTDAYLTKPFQKEELLLRMQMLISKRQKLQTTYAVEKLEDIKLEKAPDKNLMFLNEVKGVIHNHIEDSNFNATELSKALAMSDSQLYRKLKAISNSSTSIFIRKVRLEKSKELLKTTDYSVSEVAYATGFNDPNWFSKAFKEAYQESPTAFRN